MSNADKIRLYGRKRYVLSARNRGDKRFSIQVGDVVRELGLIDRVPAVCSALKTSKTVIITKDEHDVFGDGTVVIKSTPGHSPDHQVLFLKLAKTGPILLSGDLYHYPEERKLNRVPTTEFNAQQTVASRAAVEEFLKKTRAQLWIQHDFTANARLKKAPEFYD